MARVRCVQAIAMLFERRARRLQAPSPASPGRATRAQSLLRRRRIAREPQTLSDQRHAPRVCRSAFARTRSPSCAIAIPRSASAGASSRSATRFSAPSGSPAARARAAAVISESIYSRAALTIPPHLSLPPVRCPAAKSISRPSASRLHRHRREQLHSQPRRHARGLHKRRGTRKAMARLCDSNSSRRRKNSPAAATNWRSSVRPCPG